MPILHDLEEIDVPEMPKYYGSEKINLALNPGGSNIFKI